MGLWWSTAPCSLLWVTGHFHGHRRHGRGSEPRLLTSSPLLGWHPHSSPQVCSRPGSESACTPRGRLSWPLPLSPCAISRLVSCSRFSRSSLGPPQLWPHPGSGPTWSQSPAGGRCQRGLEARPLGCWILVGSIPVPGSGVAQRPPKALAISMEEAGRRGRRGSSPAEGGGGPWLHASHEAGRGAGKWAGDSALFPGAGNSRVALTGAPKVLDV